MSLRIELHLDLGQLEVNRPAAMPLCTQCLTQTAQGLKHRADVLIVRDKRLLPREHLVHECIGKAACNVNDARHDLVAPHLAVRADLHLTRHREAVNALVEAANAVREFTRQHRNHAVNEIDARPALCGLHVERLTRTDVVADIGNVDTEEEAAVLLVRIDAVVDVLRVLTVDGHDREVAAVTPSRILFGQRVLGAARSGSRHGGRKLLVQIVRTHDGEHIHAGIARLAEHLDDASLGTAPFLGPLRDLYDNLAARLCPAEVLFQNEDVAPDLRAVGRDKTERLAALERPDDVRIRTLQNADNLALTRTPLCLGRCDTRDNAVAVHGCRKHGAGHEDIRLVLCRTHVGDDKAEPLRRHGETADHEVHAARQPVEPAAVADDRSVRFKRSKCRRKQRLVRLGQTKPRAHLRLGQRAIGVLPHKGVYAFLQRIQLFHNLLFFPFLFFSFRTVQQKFRSTRKDALSDPQIERQQMPRIGQDELLTTHAADIVIEIVRALWICRVVTRSVYDQNRCCDPCNLPAENCNDIHHLVNGDKRHPPIGVVRTARHIAELAARLRHIAVDARLARRKVLDPLLGGNHDRRTKTDHVGKLCLHGEQQGKDCPHRVTDHGDLIARAAEDGIPIAHGVHPVLVLHAAQILDRRPMPRKPYCEHSKTALVQILAHQTQLCGQSRKSVNEEDTMRASRQKKRLRSFKVHDNSSFAFLSI